MSRFGKKKIQEAAAPVELNIMPFIDVFSLLCTFLLFSAVFISIGIHVVQVPFLTNAAPNQDEPKRVLNVKVDASLQGVTLTRSWSEAPIESKTEKFAFTKDGLQEFHSALIKIRETVPDTEKLDLFVDNEMNYEQFIELLDVIKLRSPQDLPFTTVQGRSSLDLFPKVVLGSVIL